MRKKGPDCYPLGPDPEPCGGQIGGPIWIIDLVSKNVCKRRLISSVELLHDILIGRTYQWGFQISLKEDDFLKEVIFFSVPPTPRCRQT